ncbi:amino acid transporter [Infundibulicybe gibba]|nr:amino acid transporter [Infundibulicybe gibba]
MPLPAMFGGRKGSRGVVNEKASGDSSSVHSIEGTMAIDPTLNPGTLSFEEALASSRYCWWHGAPSWRVQLHDVDVCHSYDVGRIIGTGIFATPSSILGSVGSVGASLLLWVLGFSLSFCGLFVWLEYGTMFPRSGGEKVYLEAVYKKPRYLVPSFSPPMPLFWDLRLPDAFMIVAAGRVSDRWTERVMVFVTLLQGFTPKIGIWVMNALSLFKIFILLFIVIAGWVVLAGGTRVQDPHVNFRNAFEGSSKAYATAMFKVLNAYAGWSNVNYVMNDVKNPVRTLKIAGPLGLGICAMLYLLANIAYFAAASKEEIRNSGVTVASLFFGKVFGAQAQKALSVFVALRYVRSIYSAPGLVIHSTQRFGALLEYIRNVMTVTYSASKVNQELAKEGIPLPFGNRFWASNWPTGKSPLPGLIVHLIPSLIIIIAPPPAVAYPFILNVEGYPQQIINFFIVIGLFWLRYTKPAAVRPFKVWWPLAVFFLAAAVFLMVAPFIRPANGVGDTPPLPYYLYCLVGISVMILGVLYWAVWRVILPKVFGYNLIPRKETLDDGTVVTIFSHKKTE